MVDLFMVEKVKKIRVFIASPSDCKDERESLPLLFERLNRIIASERQIVLELVRWETNTWPGFGIDSQDVINEQIGAYDIFIGIMWNRLGTPTSRAQSGTVEEFENAFKLWKQTNNPKLLFYFKNQAFLFKSDEELEQRKKVISFQDTLKKLGGYYIEYENIEEFKISVFEHLANEIRGTSFGDSNITVSESSTIKKSSFYKIIGPDQIDLLRVPNSRSIYSSFQPSSDPPFYRIYADTTFGFINGELNENKIYLIRDPIRPYLIQIGETRAIRKKGNPEAIPELTSLSLKEIQTMFPFIQGDSFRWLRMVLSELTTNSDVLDFIGTNDTDEEIRKMAANNPSAPEHLQKKQCLFCNPKFRELRKMPPPASSEKTIIFRNDFPYGPFFHYIAMPSDPVHSWEEIQEKHLVDMNYQIWSFLNFAKKQDNLTCAGVYIGFNSTIRHLVLGKRVRASAGASIAHVHKQIWGMVPGSVNIGDYLARICTKFYFEKETSIDYLGSYLSYLRKAGHIVWEDDNVSLFVPMGQISTHELQIIVKKERHNFLELNHDEIKSLSKAEYYVTQFYKMIGITSFNEILISEPFNKETKGFRLIMAFVTREVDLAVSELNHLYVVDKFPDDTLIQIKKYKEQILSKI